MIPAHTESLHASLSHQSTSHNTRKKWTREEELLLLHLFRTYGRSWHKYTGHYTGRNISSIKNKYYTLLRRGDAHNRAVYGSAALSEEHAETIERYEHHWRCIPFLPAPQVPVSHISDISIISRKNPARSADSLHSASHLTPDPTAAFQASESLATQGLPSIAPGSDCRDVSSMERVALCKDDGILTPPLLTEQLSLLTHSEASDQQTDHDTKNQATVQSTYKAEARTNYPPPGLRCRNIPVNPNSNTISAGCLQGLGLAFTIPHPVLHCKEHQQTSAYQPRIVPPLQYYHIHGYRDSNPYSCAPSMDPLTPLAPLMPLAPYAPVSTVALPLTV